MAKKSKPTRQELETVKTVANIQSQKIERIPFTGMWFEAFGNPQNRSVWFVYGGSASGKSTFAMQLAKELANHYRTLYNLLEEEMDDSDYIDRTELCQVQDVADNFKTQSYNINDLGIYFKRRIDQGCYVAIIDSAPYFFKTWDEYITFKRRWAKDKIIIIVGHDEGKNPSTELQKRIMYDAKMKIFVNGYLATCKGRTIGPNGGNFIIWKEGYDKINGTNSAQLIN